MQIWCTYHHMHIGYGNLRIVAVFAFFMEWFRSWNSSVLITCTLLYVSFKKGSQDVFQFILILPATRPETRFCGCLAGGSIQFDSSWRARERRVWNEQGKRSHKVKLSLNLAYSLLTLILLVLSYLSNASWIYKLAAKWAERPGIGKQPINKYVWSRQA